MLFEGHICFWHIFANNVWSNCSSWFHLVDMGTYVGSVCPFQMLAVCVIFAVWQYICIVLWVGSWFETQIKDCARNAAHWLLSPGDRAWMSCYDHCTQRMVLKDITFIVQVSQETALSQYDSLSWKMVLKRPVICDPVHLFGAAGRQSICWQTELYRSVWLYSKDGLVIAV